MTSTLALQADALAACARRGHTMSDYNEFSPTRGEFICQTCGAYVQVDSNPPPNGIDIGGNAVALNCPVQT